MKRQMKYERIFNTDGGCKKGNCNQGTLNCSQKRENDSRRTYAARSRGQGGNLRK